MNRVTTLLIVIIIDYVIGQTNSTSEYPIEVKTNSDKSEKKTIAIIVSSLFVSFLIVCAVILIIAVVIRKYLNVRSQKQNNEEEITNSLSTSSNPEKKGNESISNKPMAEVSIELETTHESTTSSFSSTSSVSSQTHPNGNSNEENKKGLQN
ncbi:hypothetical protein KM1_251300 [Entamoeba histolytica HM-3:IMSS]|uniref:Uncharacterized protein n=4 Tax=Entamoeba histolytica TaxID=5759 RepID=C4M227_ENTH1|nr:hypothetical protein EHI_150460 [Entamoeba histolytica HM-1:IMSS]EAL50460.1 hypothetical protein EHI_150460 [Entamoeba histolytica HM-1:IMSS]EMS10847.1 hypothetical protein KM1_251300 [Entamoeba histolytica HM-3:IMSS]ENY61953.1 hypothetical protein EHI7A_161700 [Entamoeba histolytica HM-1:IMSS-A]GAT95307.1 hypothetical protein CL6EHI_150460 [Entamoeba histolytica]|eukprot:XP_655846.1 hypothetical protein EHI_150460 [Entamoeba histolytica HM-1:IMSS]